MEPQSRVSNERLSSSQLLRPAHQAPASPWRRFLSRALRAGFAFAQRTSAAAPVSRGVTGLQLQKVGGVRAAGALASALSFAHVEASGHPGSQDVNRHHRLFLFLPGILIKVIVYYFPIIFLCLKITISSLKQIRKMLKGEKSCENGLPGFPSREDEGLLECWCQSPLNNTTI